MESNAGDAYDRDEIVARRRDELDALQAFYGNDLLPASSVAPSSQQHELEEDGKQVPIDGPWMIKLGSRHGGGSPPTLEIRLPSSYPEGSESPTPSLRGVGALMSSAQVKMLLSELMEMYEPEMEVAIAWAERCRENYSDLSEAASDEQTPIGENAQRPTTTNQTDGPAGREDQVGCEEEPNLKMVFLSYNHLIQGKQHKKESQLVSTASDMGLTGVVVYGTPGLVGIIVCAGSSRIAKNLNASEEDVDEYAKECGRIGKRASVSYEFSLSKEGLPECLNHTSAKQTGGKNKKGGGNKSNGNKGRSGGVGACNGNESNERRGIGPLLVDLFGENRIRCDGDSSESVTIVKTGLMAFASCSELKEVLNSHGADEALFKNILGIS